MEAKVDFKELMIMVMVEAHRGQVDKSGKPYYQGGSTPVPRFLFKFAQFFILKTNIWHGTSTTFPGLLMNIY